MEKLVALWPDDLSSLPDPSFWSGRRVALTGHTGFKGCWLALLLHRLGAQVFGYALPPSTQPNLFEAARVAEVLQSTLADVCDAQGVAAWLHACQPEVVLHLAAQALVRPSYADPLQTFATNIMGTAHVLEAVRGVPSVKAVVIVTTDKVYRNQETTHPYSEHDALGGHDPYSASKAASELVVASYRDSFLSEIGVATARAGNVIGGGDWSAERLLPDAVRAWDLAQVLQIRRPEAVRPWQHVLEPLSAYLVLAQQLFVNPSLGRAYNFGPALEDAVSVRQVVEMARTHFGVGEVCYAQELYGPHEAGLLQLDAGLARHVLNVGGRWRLTQAVERSMAWYRGYAAEELARDLCEADMRAYFGSRSIDVNA